MNRYMWGALTIAALLLLGGCRPLDDLKSGISLDYQGEHRDAIVVCARSITSEAEYVGVPGDLLISDVVVETAQVDEVRTRLDLAGNYTINSRSHSPTVLHWTCELTHYYGQYRLVAFEIK